MATKTPIDSGLIARISGAFNALMGKTPSQTSIDNGQAWFGPLNPPEPQLTGQQAESVRGRQFDFPVGANLRYRPRADEAVTFDQMRALASSCDILRLVIETRKDQISKMAFNIKVRGDEKAADVRCDEIAAFFRRPDGENTWADWLRQLMEEMLVTDAATVYPWLTNSGKPYRFDLMDGSTIKRVITDKGRTPEYPQPAYQQILKGIPAINYNRNEIVYAPRNKRVNKIYGYSPVEQIVMSVNIAIRRALHQLQYYTEGSTPDLIFQVPTDWNMPQIKDFNDWWQDSLSGNTAVRRKAQFVPAGVNPINTKDAILKDQYDEWLARIICYAFSISPQAFVKEQNRATAESAREQALAEGLQPMMAWVKGVIDELITRYFGYDDIEFVWDLAVNVDPEVQARIDDIGLKNGSKTINEVRAKHGEEPVEGGDVPMTLTASGYVSIIPAPVVQPEMQIAPDAKDEPPAPTTKIEKAQKPKKIIQPINRNSPAHNKVRENLAKGLKAIFADQREALTKKLTKGDGDKKNPIDDDGWQDWQSYNDLFNKNLSASAKLGTTAAYVQIGLDSESSLKVANKNAIDWALERSAYMVGKTIDENGDVVDNPNSDYSIDDSTREMLRADVAQAMEEGMSNDELADLISENYAFSDARAETIARTETANADCAGNEILYKDSGVVNQKEWATGADCCEDCDMLNGEVVDLDENFSNGESSPPAHPNCRCDFLPVLSEEEN